MLVVKALDRQHEGDLLALFERKQVDDRTAAGVGLALGQLEDVDRIDPARRGEAHDHVVRVGDEELGDLVVLRHLLNLAALAAARLSVVVGEVLALDVAAARERDDHVAARNQVALVEVRIAHEVDRRAALVAVLLADVLELLADDRVDAFGTGENVEAVGDAGHHGGVVGADLVLLEAGQAAQAHCKDVVDLNPGEVVEAVLLDAAGGVHVLGIVAVHVLDAAAGKLLGHGRGPAAAVELVGGVGRRLGVADDADELVEVRERNRLAFEQMALGAVLAEAEDRAARHNFAAV